MEIALGSQLITNDMVSRNMCRWHDTVLPKHVQILKFTRENHWWTLFLYYAKLALFNKYADEVFSSSIEVEWRWGCQYFLYFIKHHNFSAIVIRNLSLLQITNTCHDTKCGFTVPAWKSFHGWRITGHSFIHSQLFIQIPNFMVA